MKLLEGKDPQFFMEDGIEYVTFQGTDGLTTLSIGFIERVFCDEFEVEVIKHVKH
jgi:hypothetical protein